MINPVALTAPSTRLYLAQFVAMLRYEFRILWRQRRLLVIMVALAIVTGVISILFNDEIRDTRTLLLGTQYIPLRTRQELAEGIMTILWMPIHIVVAGMVSVVAGEVIPQDRHYRTDELLGALPLPTGIYLAGKVLSMCLVVWVALCPAIVLPGVLWRLLVGPYDLLTYLGLWAVFVMPLVLITPGLAVLLASGQPNRRRGMLAGAAFGLICFFLMAVSNSVWMLLNPSRPVLFLYFFHKGGTTGDALLAVIIGLVEVMVAGIGIWAWQRWRNRTI
jgi:hypothetical protein